MRVSRAVAKLLHAGYITRIADPADRRRAVLELTPKGAEVYRQIVPLVQTVEAEILAELTQDERASLEGALGKIEAYLEAAGEAGVDADEDSD